MKNIIINFWRSIIFIPVVELILAIAVPEVAPMAFFCTLGLFLGFALFMLLSRHHRETFMLRCSAINAILTHDRAFILVLNRYEEFDSGRVRLNAGGHWVNWPKAIQPGTVAELYSEASLQNEIEGLVGEQK